MTQLSRDGRQASLNVIPGYGFGTMVWSLLTGPGAPPHAVGHDADAL